LPEGWARGGSHPGRYEMGLDEGKYYTGGTAAAFIRSMTLEPLPNGNISFATVCQKFYPKTFLDKKVKLTGRLCYNLCADSWTGLWVKVDLKVPQDRPRSFRLDNMNDRKLCGSSEGEWIYCEVETDIPVNVESVSFGFLMCGTGIVWSSDLQFEIIAPRARKASASSPRCLEDRMPDLANRLRTLALNTVIPSSPPDPATAANINLNIISACNTANTTTDNNPDSTKNTNTDNTNTDNTKNTNTDDSLNTYNTPALPNSDANTC